MHGCVHVKSLNKASEYGGTISNYCHLSSDLVIVKLGLIQLIRSLCLCWPRVRVSRCAYEAVDALN